MSKIKEAMERTREREYDEYVSFLEWVCDQKVSVNVTDEEEESSTEPSTTGISIVPANTLKAVNNADYNPKRSRR